MSVYRQFRGHGYDARKVKHELDIGVANTKYECEIVVEGITLLSMKRHDLIMALDVTEHDLKVLNGERTVESSTPDAGGSSPAQDVAGRGEGKDEKKSVPLEGRGTLIAGEIAPI